MSEQNPEAFVTQEVFVKALNAVDAHNNTKLTMLETRLEQFEKQTAILVQGYAELAALVESIVSIFINKDADQTKEFFEVLATARKTMIETLQHGIEIADANSDRFVAHSTGADEELKSDPAPDNQ